jgi:hypothetical protein
MNVSRRSLLGGAGVALAATTFGCDAQSAGPPAATTSDPPSAAAPATVTSASWTVNVRDFGAKGDGRTDDSQAFIAARNAILGSRREGVPLKPVLLIPPGSYLITTPNALMEPTNVARDFIDGLTIQGAGKHVSTVLFRPHGKTSDPDALNLMTWRNTSTGGGRVINFRCRDISFDCNNDNASFLYSYSTSTNPNHDILFENVEWSGSWRRVIGLDGPDDTANLNSEIGLYNCETWGPTSSFGDAFFNSAVTPGDTSNQQDQFVNFWFRDCLFGWQSGHLLKFPKGGSINVFGGSWTCLGAGPYNMIWMPFHPHNFGAQRLLVMGLRVELRAPGQKFINCEWLSGSVEIISLDESAEAWQGYAPSLNAHRYRWADYNSGPIVTYRGCVLMGYHLVDTGSAVPAPGKIRYDGCLWINHASGQINAVHGSGGLLRWSNAAPHFRFTDCYGATVTLDDANA